MKSIVRHRWCQPSARWLQIKAVVRDEQALRSVLSAPAKGPLIKTAGKQADRAAPLANAVKEGSVEASKTICSPTGGHDDGGSLAVGGGRQSSIISPTAGGGRLYSAGNFGSMLMRGAAKLVGAPLVRLLSRRGPGSEGADPFSRAADNGWGLRSLRTALGDAAVKQLFLFKRQHQQQEHRHAAQQQQQQQVRGGH